MEVSGWFYHYKNELDEYIILTNHFGFTAGIDGD